MIEQFYFTDGTLTITTSLGKSGSESNDNEKVLHIPQTPQLENYHKMQFSFISRNLKFSSLQYHVVCFFLSFTHAMDTFSTLCLPLWEWAGLFYNRSSLTFVQQEIVHSFQTTNMFLR